MLNPKEDATKERDDHGEQITPLLRFADHPHVVWLEEANYRENNDGTQYTIREPHQARRQK